MIIGPITPFSQADPVTSAAPIRRVVRDAQPGQAPAKTRAATGQRKRDPLAAAKGPAASASPKTQAALDDLMLGG